MRRLAAILPGALAVALAAAALASANTSHDGWPRIDGVLLMNKTDRVAPARRAPRPRPVRRHATGATRATRSTSAASATAGSSRRRGVRGRVMTSRHGHNELLGGHGNDTIHAGPWGDVIWGDYKPSGQPTPSTTRSSAAPAATSSTPATGATRSRAGGGNDWIKAHFGRGS